MLNAKILSRTIGSLLFVEGGLLLIALIVTLIYREDFMPFTVSALIAFLIGFILKYFGRKSGNNLNRRDAFFIVAVTWIIFSTVGMVPMLLSGTCSNITDAFFETMSGFTTTGTTNLNNIDDLPRGILMWRSLTHWIGGLGIVIFTMALLPSSGESCIKLFAAEATGPTHEKLHPRMQTTIKWLLSLYFIFTFLCALALYLCGINVFDSINHSMATIATGGFSTHSDGIMYFHSPAIEYVEIVFMFLSGINFFLLYIMFQKRSIKKLIENSEFKFYVGCFLITSAVAALSLILISNYGIERAIRSALFNVISVQTTTGFVSENISLWWRPVWFFLFFVMITGGSAGSTSGGAKCIRILTLAKTASNQFRQLLHPNAFMPVRINKNIVPESVEQSLLAFFFLYMALLIGGTLCFSAMGVTFFDAINISICCLSNVGVTDGLSNYTPITNMFAFPEIGKWLCSFLMLAGRLEIFPLLLPLVPAFWKDN